LVHYMACQRLAAGGWPSEGVEIPEVQNKAMRSRRHACTTEDEAGGMKSDRKAAKVKRPWEQNGPCLLLPPEPCRGVPFAPAFRVEFEAGRQCCCAGTSPPNGLKALVLESEAGGI